MYKGKEFITGDAVIPTKFANFLVEENTEFMSPELVGVIELTVEPVPGMQNLFRAIGAFGERAATDELISESDVQKALDWVSGFEGKYGTEKRFLFE